MVRTDPSQRTLQESFLASWMKQSNTYLQRPVLPEARTTCADESLARGTEACDESRVNNTIRSEVSSSSQQWQKTNPLMTEMERIVNSEAPSTQYCGGMSLPHPLTFCTPTRTRVREFGTTVLDKLRKRVIAETDQQMRDALSRIVFIGVAGNHSLLVQYETGIYALRLATLTGQLIYQASLFRFGNIKTVKLQGLMGVENAISRVIAGMHTVVQNESVTRSMGLEWAMNADVGKAFKKLMEKVDMLYDYFGIHIDENGHLTEIPVPIDGFFPSYSSLPMFVTELALRVNYEDEEQFFDNVAKCIASLYERKWLSYKPERDREALNAITAYVLLPVIKSKLLPPGSWATNTRVIRLITTQPAIFRTFNRC